MPNVMEKFRGPAYALLRMVSGFMFTLHGAQKVLGLFAGLMPLPAVGSQLWFAGIIELVGGICLVLGLRTRLVAFICSGEMAVAYFQGHWRGQLGPEFLPTVNHGELAVLYCFIFLLIAAEGPGSWAVDKKN